MKKKLYRLISTAFCNSLPKMSHTEREALEAGTVWWDAQLFSGNPNWAMLWNTPPASLTDEEINFLNHDVDELCEMVNDFDISAAGDLPVSVWSFLMDKGFFGLCIPKEYGGKGFSAYAHSEVVSKIASRSIAVAVTVMVPNSLGPAELLLHYGTQEERDKYLPGLAAGTEIPCFGLTNPTAGSDASSIPDTATVVQNEHGEVELSVDIDKRYITLAPVATLIGLAVKVKDPDGLLPGIIQERLNVGRDITVLLVPRDTEGLDIGRRHNPLDIAFMNGPIRGTDVRLPLSSVLGGVNNIGEGWAMLMDCLSVGRAISLPSLACAGGHVTAGRVGAYARLRKQFRLHIGKFEGVEEKLAMIAGHAFIMDASRRLTIAAIDNLEQKPSVLSAINKYHLTEMNRESIDAAMDILGGAGICLGPNNILGQTYKSIPISITVEGANIMTRNLIIFGQGAMRCHPHVMSEINLADLVKYARKHKPANVIAYYEEQLVKELMDHVKHVFKNVGRTMKRGVMNEDVNRFSSAFALTADVAMLMLGGSLKRKERISARLGDVLSYMYMLSAIEYEIYAQRVTRRAVNRDVFDWAHQTLCYKTQEAFYELYDNFPSKIVGGLLRRLAFPYGRVYKKPSDKLDHKVAQVILNDSGYRDSLIEGLFISDYTAVDKTGMLEQAFRLKNIQDGDYPLNSHSLAELEHLQKHIIQVDDFSNNGSIYILDKIKENKWQPKKETREGM